LIILDKKVIYICIYDLFQSKLQNTEQSISKSLS
jgi:hypothetical protein